ncbi:MAG: ABC transporter permease [Bacteroidales bacterium]|nr:ABC transporter permease [Bacteroidales bacterium]
MAYRNIIRNYNNLIVNTLGMAIGMASFIIIFLFIYNETGYDKYHKKSDRIYRVIQEGNFNGLVEKSTSCPFPLATAIANDFPEMIESVTRFFNFQSPRTMVFANEKSFNEKRLFYTDSTVFDVFDYEFIYGKAFGNLTKPNTAVITKSTAERYFGKIDVVGDSLFIEKKLPILITGVIEDLPSQSHFHFDILISMKTVERLYGGYEPNTWIWNPCWTYIVLKEGVTKNELENRFPELIEKNICKMENKDKTSFYLQPLTDIHLKSNLDYEIEKNNSIENIYLLGFVAIFLLLLACINYINLSSISSIRREKEIGMKKVHGASRKQLIIQFLLESVIISFFALFFALLLVEVFLPVFNPIFDKELVLNPVFSTRLFVPLFLITIFIGLLAGIFPAVFLSALKPANILKKPFLKAIRSGFSRKLMVVFQFVIASLLIIGAFVAKNQVSFMKNADLGFEKDNIIILESAHSVLAYNYESIKEDLLKNSDIIEVTAMDYIIGADHNTHEFITEGMPEGQWQFFPALIIRDDFVETFNIKILAGRDFEKDNPNDRTNAILVNEAMVKHMGWGTNQEALGKKFHSGYGNEKIVGVFNDFKVSSLHKKTGLFVLNLKEDEREITFYTKYIAVKIGNGNQTEIINYLEQIWKKYDPERPFEYKFLDKELEQLYKEEGIFSKLIMIFTFLSLIIGGIGLYGLTAFLTSQRNREMAVRRIFGAKKTNILGLLNKEFALLVIIANVLAWPLAYLITEQWLSNFAYSIELHWWFFLITAVITLVFSILVVSVKGIIDSEAKPIDVLRSE